MDLTAGEDAGRLDSFLAERLDELSRSRIQDLIREQHILLNGQPTKPRQAVHAGDRIEVSIPAAVPSEILPQDIPLHVLFEDEELVVIDKQPGLVVHPAAGHPDGTLVNALLHHCGNLAGIGGIERPGIVHRLDKDTSGCIVAAKSDAAHQSLVSQFANRTNDKLYLAVAQSPPSPEQGTVFTHISRHPVHRQKMAVVDPPGGRASITDYRVLTIDPADRSALVRCRLHTGRTHQIRVHMGHLGCPLLGDPIYAKPARQQRRPGRLMLHSWHLAFDHPLSGERIECTAPIPTEFDPWLALLGGVPDPDDD